MRILTFALACLCAVLGALVVWQDHQLHNLRPTNADVAPPVALDSSPSLSSSPDVSGGSAANARLASARLPEKSEPGRAAIEWGQVESGDYRSFVKNLRAIGCPEQTVRDIVTADLAQSFAPRRAQVAAACYRDFQYWKAGTDQQRRGEFQRNRRQLDEEIGRVLSALFGADASLPDTSREWQAAAISGQLAFLPSDKRAAVSSLLLRAAEIDTLVTDLTDNRLRGQSATELQRIMEAYDDKQRALSQCLTPEEHERVQMSVSWTAGNLRSRLVGFDPSEAEFQVVFREWWAHDVDLARRHALGPPDPGNLHEGVYERIRQQLGEERFGQYLRSWGR